MKLTYRTPPFDGDDDAQVMEHEILQSPGKSAGQAYIKTSWDDDYPWSIWYSAEDPLRGGILFHSEVWVASSFKHSC